MTWRGLWAGLWPGNWEGPSGEAPPEVIHPLGHVSLELVAHAGLAADQLSLEGDDFESPFEGTGGPDDERLSPAVRKWIREKYKRDPDPVPVPVPELVEAKDKLDRSTVVEDLRPPVDVGPIIESASKAVREAVAEIEAVRKNALREENKRRAVAMLLALLDD